MDSGEQHGAPLAIRIEVRLAIRIEVRRKRANGTDRAHRFPHLSAHGFHMCTESPNQAIPIGMLRSRGHFRFLHFDTRLR